MLILIGLTTILVLTAATGYFVAQEFAYVAADRNRLQRMAEQGDKAAERALRVTSRLSFTLSGSQFGITVTALMVGYVSEPYLGEGLAALLGSPGCHPRRASRSRSRWRWCSPPWCRWCSVSWHRRTWRSPAPRRWPRP